MLSDHDQKILQKLRELRTSNPNPHPDAVEAIVSQLSNTGYQLAIEIGLLTQIQNKRNELRQPGKALTVQPKTTPTFDFKGHAIRVDQDQLGAPWFVAADVCRALNYPANKVSQTTKKIPKHHKGIRSIDTPGGKQRMLCVDEPGLNRLVLRSDKPEAELFIEWVTADVLPSIRKTGAYVRNMTPRQLAELIIEKLDQAGNAGQLQSTQGAQ